MFKVFRSIRQKLFRDGKMKDYFGYALGEIFLIVIGILIALEISDWNEAQKRIALENELTENLYEELLFTYESSRTTLDSFVKLSTIIEAVLYDGDGLDLEALLEKAGDNRGVKATGFITVLLDFTNFFNPHNDTYKAAVSDGSIALISDKVWLSRLEANYVTGPR